MSGTTTAAARAAPSLAVRTEDAPLDRRLSVAPMMDWTDRHCRFFLRLITRHTLLYNEMVTTGALLHGERSRFLDFHPTEHPLALQLGGSDPDAMRACARMAEDWGYQEVNINVGCPSDRVRNGRFGACLMAEPETVAACVAAMRAAVDIPVTVKSRIGIDEHDGYEDLRGFVATIAQAGCATFIVHARKAWLNGLSPRENREIPPLRHPLVHRLKRDFPSLEIILNGGIRSLEEARSHLEPVVHSGVDGVMIGRAAYERPWILAEADRLMFGAPAPPPERSAVLEQLVPYVADMQARGVPVKAVTRHLLGLFHGLPGARAWRRHIAENAHKPDATARLILDAAAKVRPLQHHQGDDQQP